MSTRERRREIFFGIFFTAICPFLLIIGFSRNRTDMLLAGVVFLIVGSISWIKLAIHRPSMPGKARPVAQSAADTAQHRQQAAQTQQQELAAHQERRDSYKSSPEPLQIRQWNKTYLWDWKIKCHGLDRPLYVWAQGSSNIDILKTPVTNSTICVIKPKDGVWCLCPLVGDVTVHMNSESARSKCPDMAVNTQQFTVRKGQEQELLPGDCFVIIRGSAVGYFRVDRWSII